LHKHIKYTSLNRKFISINKAAELLGKDLVKRGRSRDRDLFATYIDRLPGIPKLVRKKFEKVKNTIVKYYFYDHQGIINFKNTHISRKDAIEYIGVSLATFDIYKENYKIITYKIGNKNEYKFYPRKCIEQIYNDFYYDSSKYISIYKFAEEQFENTGPSFIWRLKKCIENLPQGLITPVKLGKLFHDNKEKRYIDIVYARDEIELFKEKHISKSDVFDQLTQIVDKKTLYDLYNALNLNELFLGNQTNSIFINKDDYRKIQESISNLLKFRSYREDGILIINGLNYYTRKKTSKLLSAGPRTMNRIEEEEKELLTVEGQYKGSNYYIKESADMLIKKQKELIEVYKRNYYSFGEIKSKYGDCFARIITKMERVEYVVERVVIPALAKVFYDSKIEVIFKKDDVDNYWNTYSLNNKLNNIYFKDMYEDFKYKVEQILNISFTEKQTNTKLLWYEYVRKHLVTTNRIHSREYVQIFVRITKLIQDSFTKDVYLYNTYEINNKFLNSNSFIPRSYQRHLYNFLRNVNDTFQEQNKSVQYHVKELNNPNDYKRIKEVDNSIYKLEEYHELYNYVNRTGYHKKRAIDDVMNYIKSSNIREYKKYDSCWLYILVLLVNNWRHSTVFLQIPRIDLNGTSIKSLDWLQENDPSLEDANNIIFQIGRYVTKINKTEVRAEGIFQIGEPLKIAFAIAICICEFRTRAKFPDNPTLLMFSIGEKTVDSGLNKNKNPHKCFFEGYGKEFVFENRKMNRTLTTLIYSVLYHLDKGVKAAQISRSHIDEQTTIDHYIKLSNNQVNILVEELFERDNFGFVTQLMANIVFGESVDRRIELLRLKSIKNIYGDPIKIEATAGLINRLSQQKIEVENYIRSLSIEELKRMYQNMIAGNLASRQKHYQCIYLECKYKIASEDLPSCDGCAASIINVYALSQLMDNYINCLISIVENFDSSSLGEKRKVANHFHLLNHLVMEARSRFGRNVVNGFVDGGTERIKFLGNMIESKRIKKYVTNYILNGGDYHFEK
jgi:hypothetical protein